eukprot:gene2712-924_t
MESECVESNPQTGDRRKFRSKRRKKRKGFMGKTKKEVLEGQEKTKDIFEPGNLASEIEQTGTDDIRNIGPNTSADSHDTLNVSQTKLTDGSLYCISKRAITRSYAEKVGLKREKRNSSTSGNESHMSNAANELRRITEEENKDQIEQDKDHRKIAKFNVGQSSIADIMESCNMLPGQKTLFALRKFDAKRLTDTATKVSAKYKNRRRLLRAKRLKKTDDKRSYVSGGYGLTSTPEFSKTKKRKGNSESLVSKKKPRKDNAVDGKHITAEKTDLLTDTCHFEKEPDIIFALPLEEFT